MRVTSISPIIPNQYVKRDYKPVAVHNPSFCAGLWPASFYKTPWTKLKNITIEEYNKLSPFELHAIRKNIRRVYGSQLDEKMKFNYITASGIKAKLDTIYGENNYIVIIIGRSLSSIGKCLGYKIGEDNVKQIPMSKAGRFLDWKACSNENFKVFKKYLSSIGLSQKDIKTSGKQYIITDYRCSGNSLAGAEELFQSNLIWGKQPNVMAIGIDGLLVNIEPDKIFPDFKMKNGDFIYNLDDMLADNFFKEYSLVSKCRKLAETPDAVIAPENYSQKMKAFLFKLLDTEMQRK